jgi:hypothetical protein
MEEEKHLDWQLKTRKEEVSLLCQKHFLVPLYKHTDLLAHCDSGTLPAC